MMKKSWLIAGSTLVITLAMTTLLVVHPTLARGEESKASGVEIKVDNFTFGPDTVIVRVNSTVTWVNKDDMPHVIASNDGLFKSKTLDTDEKYSYTFAKAGTYPYYCSMHPKMVGKIVVQ